jgi:hypothetical protein
MWHACVRAHSCLFSLLALAVCVAVAAQTFERVREGMDCLGTCSLSAHLSQSSANVLAYVDAFLTSNVLRKLLFCCMFCVLCAAIQHHTACR